MKVVVCTKQTPSTTAVFAVVNGVVNWDDPGDKPKVVNPWDEYAIEEAIRITENHGAESATALTLGDDDAADVLKTALAMGIGEAVHVNDPAYAGADIGATARILAAAIQKMDGVEIALFGKRAIDGETGQVPIQVARRLGWTPLTFVSAIQSIADGQITVERLLDHGKETVTAPLPVVISVVKEINEPRYPSFMGIRKANRATIPVWTNADLGLEGELGAAGATVDWSNVYGLPAREGSVTIFSGDSPAAIGRQLADRLYEEKVI